MSSLIGSVLHIFSHSNVKSEQLTDGAPRLCISNWLTGESLH